ncbi:MAG: DUF1294 domain-containing protein [Verrucomicrobiota bacterium]
MNGISQTAKVSDSKAVIGRIAEWNDAKGYGWLDAGGKRVFVHIKDFERGQRRPVVGAEVSFTPGTDEQGRSRATALRLTKQGEGIAIGAWLIWAVLLVLPLSAGLFLPVPEWVLPTVMALVSLAAWFAYRSDKRRAQAGEWRIPEANLHLLELLGGWPGAFLAQRKFRHKTRKLSFQVVFVGIVLVHQLAAVDVIFGHLPSRLLLAKVGKVLREP